MVGNCGTWALTTLGSSLRPCSKHTVGSNWLTRCHYVPWVIASEGGHNHGLCGFPPYLHSASDSGPTYFYWGEINKKNHLICAFCWKPDFRAGNGCSDRTQHLSGEQGGQLLSWLRYYNSPSSFSVQQSFSGSSPGGPRPMPGCWILCHHWVCQKSLSTRSCAFSQLLFFISAVT